jgi:hypothetical protein
MSDDPLSGGNGDPPNRTIEDLLNGMPERDVNGLPKLDDLLDELETMAQYRRWSDMYRLWRLCDRPLCRRARACRGDGQKCFRRHAKLIPERARLWLLMLRTAQEWNIPFEEAVEGLEQERVAYRAWVAAMDGMERKPRAQAIAAGPDECPKRAGRR